MSFPDEGVREVRKKKLGSSLIDSLIESRLNNAS